MDINPKKNEYREPLILEDEAGKETMLKKNKNIFLANWRKILLVLLALVILWKVLTVFGAFSLSGFPTVDKGKWQAVFLTNGQVYFGHLGSAGRGYTILKNVYYFRASQQKSSSGQQQIDVVKLGNEIHNPEDTMYIASSQIVFWENMKDNSEVLRIIKQLEEKK